MKITKPKPSQARQVINTELANDANAALFRLRVAGANIPQDVWDSIIEAQVALDRWFESGAKNAPTKVVSR